RDVYKRQALLFAHPGTLDAVAGLLGCDGTWAAPDGEPAGPAGAVLTARHPATAIAWEALLTGA
ncbi:hypothetical protein, partial [Streptomyces sp. st170]|uniref:hypothetical protein n=1 Tax=Streptomyces sp. st170 TaxID=1828058 RepID=UPI00117E416F